MKILVVDDNPKNVYLLEALLKDHGYEVSTAVNGNEALEQLKREPASLIISDILLQKSDEFQLCRAVKADDALKNIPFIFYTTTSTTEKDKDFALSFGATRFILNPADPKEFISIIKEVLAENKIGLHKSRDITRAKETECLKDHQAHLIKKLEDKIAELERSEKRYRRLFETAKDGILILDAETGMVVDVNPFMIEMLGFSHATFLGKKIWELGFFKDIVANHDNFVELQQQGYVRYEDKPLETADGRRIDVEFVSNVYLVNNQKVIQCNIRNITERKRMDVAFRDAEMRYHLLFDQSPDGIVIIDPETVRFLEFNETACRQLGYSREEFARLNMSDFEAAETPEDTKKRITKVMLEGRNDYETLHRTRQGEIRYVHVTAQITEISGRPVYHCVWRDITEHRKLENQYLHAQKMESIGTLAGGIAHDFNNILSAIIGYGHVALKNTSEDDPQRLNIESMLEAADRGAHLTKDLLLFSRKQVSEPKAVDLNKAVGRVEKFLKHVIGEDIACKTTVTKYPLMIVADSHQLEQALMNLATNARDAMPGGGTFTVQTEEVTLHEDFPAAHGYGKPGLYAMLTVSDSGTGMDGATRKRIFEPFFTTKEVGKGTGLGLAVVYGIIKQHDGFINVYSEPGKGTTFRIYLPIITSAVREETAALQEEAPARGTETVLLAEDDEPLRKLSRTILVEYGYTVIEAVDGEDAVRKFMENKETIRVLLFDLIMPKMNGKEACDEIRKVKPDVKAIFASGYAPDIIRQKALLEDGASLIYKPVFPLALLRKVRSVLDGKVNKDREGRI